MLTRNVNRRLICSMAACLLETSMSLSLVAVRPVVAAEAGTGETDQATADDDDAEQHQRADADGLELGGREALSEPVLDATSFELESWQEATGGAAS
jgi:hypothetical protein